MQRLYGASNAVNLFPIDCPNENTHLLYFRRSAATSEERDQFTVFICNRSTQTMTKSALAPPSNVQRGEPVFGTAKAHIVAMTTSTMFPQDSDPAICVVGGDTKVEKAVPVSGMVVKGVIAWDDLDFQGVRFVVIYSVPEDYKIINKLSFGDLVDPNAPTSSSAPSSSSETEGSKKKKKKSKSDVLEEEEDHQQMSMKFAHVLINVANEFKAMMAERPATASPKPMPVV